MSESAFELNFDGLVGPTHNYAGLSLGNVASLNNVASISNPREAALQGLEKMKALHDMGLKQGVLAPMERPDIFTLRQLGFSGSDANILQQARRRAEKLLVACSSASSMWAANACTMAPSTDTADHRVHFTPANLANKFHRSIEWPTTGAILQAMFADTDHFVHHSALPTGEHFGDEGAANHTRLCDTYADRGLQFFVYGKYAFDSTQPAPSQFPARQTREASEAIARLHQLAPEHTVFAQQNPAVIDQGVFHNDVIAVGNQNVLFYHQQAFLDTPATQAELKQKYPGNKPLAFIEVPSAQVSIADAVGSYLFNSQLVNNERDKMTLICPGECRENQRVSDYLDQLLESGTAIDDVRIYDVKQSMRNGGGPACLRQRVVLNETELRAINPECLLSEPLYVTLRDWVQKHYRDRILESDLADVALLQESRQALDELTRILHLGSVYRFQQVG